MDLHRKGLGTEATATQQRNNTGRNSSNGSGNGNGNERPLLSPDQILSSD